MSINTSSNYWDIEYKSQTFDKLNSQIKEAAGIKNPDYVVNSITKYFINYNASKGLGLGLALVFSALTIISIVAAMNNGTYYDTALSTFKHAISSPACIAFGASAAISANAFLIINHRQNLAMKTQKVSKAEFDRIVGEAFTDIKSMNNENVSELKALQDCSK